MNVSLDWSITQRLLGALTIDGETLVLSVTSSPDELPEADAAARMRRGLELGILRAVDPADTDDLTTYREMLAAGIATWST